MATATHVKPPPYVGALRDSDALLCLFVYLSPETLSAAGAYRIGLSGRTCLLLLESRGNYSVTTNNMKLLDWPLMGGLLYLV